MTQESWFCPPLSLATLSGPTRWRGPTCPRMRLRGRAAAAGRGRTLAQRPGMRPTSEIPSPPWHPRTSRPLVSPPPDLSPPCLTTPEPLAPLSHRLCTIHSICAIQGEDPHCPCPPLPSNPPPPCVRLTERHVSLSCYGRMHEECLVIT